MASLPGIVTPSYKDRRGWLVAFGVVEIFIACLFLFFAVMIAFVLPSIPMPAEQPAMPKGLFILMGLVFYLPFAAVYMAVGIGSIRARNWARIAMIVLSSIWLGIGVLGTLGMAVLMPAILRQQQAMTHQSGATLPEGFQSTMMIVMVAVQAIFMVLAPLTFLLFYASRNVKATCQAASLPRIPAPEFVPPQVAAPPAVSAPSSVSGPPVLVILLAVWKAFSALSVLAAAALVPMAFLFGFVVRGIAARLLMLALFAVYAFCAWGLYKLRTEGWWVSVAVSVFWMISGLVSMVRLDMSAYVAEMYRTMGIGSLPFDIFKENPGFMQFSMGMGILFGVVILALLIYSKRYFRRQVEAG